MSSIPDQAGNSARINKSNPPKNQNLHGTLRPCKFLFPKVFGRGYRGNLFSKRFPLMRSQKQKEMTLDRRLTHTRPRVTSVRSWYLTSFVILSFYCLPFLNHHYQAKRHLFLRSQRGNTLCFLCKYLFSKGECGMQKCIRLRLERHTHLYQA